MIEYSNILFCTDFSEDANIAFLHALNLAKKYGAKLHILHVPHSPFQYMRHVVDEDLPEGKATEGQTFYDQGVVDEARIKLGSFYEKKMQGFNSYEFVVVCGAPDIEIIRYAKKNGIDLIVMGALGKSDLGDPDRGSTVASVSKYAHCHVMAIRNPLKQFTLPILG
ncbi:MAG: universal stress protein [Syntrophobacteraceae bacterium]|jgi:nucleotide-binding universal stress UspA family protein